MNLHIHHSTNILVRSELGAKIAKCATHDSFKFTHDLKLSWVYQHLIKVAFALYRIPKMVEKIVERLAIYPGRLPHAGMVRQAELLQLGADNVAFMVGELRKGTKMDRISEANEKLQLAEGEADKVMLSLEKELYQGPYEAKEVIFLLQLFEMVEKSVDRCRDAGNVVFQIVLKYS